MSSSRGSDRSGWKRWLRPLALTLSLLALVLVVPAVVWQLRRHHANIHTKAWFVGGLFFALTVPVSLWGIVQHLVHFSRPDLQGPMIRILWMVPIFSLVSWAILIWPEYVSHLETLRDVYEAVALYSFRTLLGNFLRAQYPNLGEILEAKEPRKAPFPFCWLTRWWPRGERWRRLSQPGMRQYVAVTLFYFLAANICEFLKVFHKGTFAWSSAWLYLAALKSVSKVVALFSLWAFYQSVKEEAKPIEPRKKFASLRLVLFLTFWQSLLIALLVKVGVISSSTWDWQSAQAVGAGLHNFALCVEMLLAAIGFNYTYSYTPYMEERVTVTFCSLLLDICNISPMTQDILTHDTFSGSKESSSHTDKDECVIQVSYSQHTLPTSTDNQPDTAHALPSLY